MGKSQARKQLRALRQTGTVADYIVAEANICAELDFAEDERIDLFIEGLKNPLRNRMWKRKCTTFDDLLNEVNEDDGITTLGAVMEANPDAMDIDAMQMYDEEHSVSPSLRQEMHELRQVVQQLATNRVSDVAALNWQSGRQQQQRNYLPRGQPSRPVRMVSISIGGNTMSVSNQEGWVRRWLRDNHRCFECAGEHQARDCNLSGNGTGRN
ncbi:hypothetical protein LPJ77_005543 [Coemansia sp. RSA 2523]|nr:hypothetical protein LPJ77_005543 [Coemansia sp. RSA 2523]